MLDINVTIEGDKVLIEGLEKFARQIPQAVQRGLGKAAEGIFTAAHAWLSGSGAKGITSGTVVGGKIKNQKWTPQSLPAGRYPVPVRTGNLRQHLNWLKPGETKADDSGSFTAGEFEAIIYDSAAYAYVIHEGRGSSAKYGPRRYATDALEQFNRGAHIAELLNEEVEKAQKESGL